MRTSQIVLQIAGFAAVGSALLVPFNEVPTLAPPHFSPLTATKGVERSPAFVPGGHDVVYARDGRLYLQRVGGTEPIELLPGFETPQRDPAVSRDGSTIAFSTPSGLWTCGPTGESPRKVVAAGYEPSFAPNGDLVYVDQPLADPFSIIKVGAVWRTRADGTGTPTPIGALMGFEPVLSPDGAHLAYWDADRKLVITDATGTSPVVVAGGDGRAAWHPRWSHDGSHLYYLSEAMGTTDVLRVPIVDGKPADVPEAVTAGTRDSVWEFDLADDDAAIVFDAVRVITDLFDFDLSTYPPKVTPITHGRHDYGLPSVSPDGSLIAVTAFGRPTERLMVIKRDGTGLRELVSGGRNRWATFSPDGTRLAFMSTRDGRYDVWVVGTDGSGLTNLTRSDPESIEAPMWAPDGVIHAVATPSYRLVRVGLDGVLTDEPKPPFPYEDPPEISPDGLFTMWAQSDGTGKLVDGAQREIATFDTAWIWTAPHTLLAISNGQFLSFDPVSGARMTLADLPTASLEGLGAPRDGSFAVLAWGGQSSDLWVASLATP